ncbi:tyrosinase family oxidase copper chaperone [Streptomyces sp. NPDC004647]|uniref:apotyrosinase chaperone MelC1 n=1 Tax=Streptomyces sp. NPDC004647 TaxID=3154671 RepID=UPI0033AA5939
MSRPTRRHVLRGSALVLAGAALATPAAVAAATASRSGAPDKRPVRSGTSEIPEAFSEVYLGRLIEGRPMNQDEGHEGNGGHGGHGGSHADRGGHQGHGAMGYSVRVDGEELHVMQNADSTWISVVNHYETFRTPRAVARAAVRELHGADLVPVPVG